MQIKDMSKNELIEYIDNESMKFTLLRLKLTAIHFEGIKNVRHRKHVIANYIKQHSCIAENANKAINCLLAMKTNTEPKKAPNDA